MKLAGLPRLNMSNHNDPRVYAHIHAYDFGWKVTTVNGERRLGKGSRYVTEYQLGKEAMDYAEAAQHMRETQHEPPVPRSMGLESYLKGAQR